MTPCRRSKLFLSTTSMRNNLRVPTVLVLAIGVTLCFIPAAHQYLVWIWNSVSLHFTCWFALASIHCNSIVTCQGYEGNPKNSPPCHVMLCGVVLSFLSADVWCNVWAVINTSNWSLLFEKPSEYFISCLMTWMWYQLVSNSVIVLCFFEIRPLIILITFSCRGVYFAGSASQMGTFCKSIF